MNSKGFVKALALVLSFVVVTSPSESLAATKQVCIKKCKKRFKGSAKAKQRGQCVKKCTPLVMVPVDMTPFITLITDATPNPNSVPLALDFLKSNLGRFTANDFNTTLILAPNPYAGLTISGAVAKIASELSGDLTDPRFMMIEPISKAISTVIQCIPVLAKGGTCVFGSAAVSVEATTTKEGGKETTASKGSIYTN